MMDVNQACEAFKVLLEQQLDRVAKMNTNKKDFSTQKVITIGVVDGDGIGPIITAQASRVLEKVLADDLLSICHAGRSKGSIVHPGHCSL